MINEPNRWFSVRRFLEKICRLLLGPNLHCSFVYRGSIPYQSTSRLARSTLFRSFLRRFAWYGNTFYSRGVIYHNIFSSGFPVFRRDGKQPLASNIRQDSAWQQGYRFERQPDYAASINRQNVRTRVVGNGSWPWLLDGTIYETKTNFARYFGGNNSA